MPVVLLTAQMIKGLRPPATGRVEYWDVHTPGLCLRITANGAASWSFRYRPREGGKRNERVTFGSVSVLSLADARDRAARVRADVVDGGNPQLTRRQKREAAKNVLTFDVLAQRYLDEYSKPRKASWKDDAHRLKRPRGALGHREASAITRRDVIAFLDDVKRTAPVQANRMQTAISGVFNWAIDEELLEINPIARLKKRAKETAATRVLSDPEIRALWRALDMAARSSVTGQDVAAALKLILLTGVRPVEATGALQLEFVNIEDPKMARWEIGGQRMKKRRPHVVPLARMACSLVLESIARRREEGETGGVFGSRYLDRETLARNSLSVALKRLVPKLEAKGNDAEAIKSLQADPPVPHDLRRTVATGLAALGIAREDRLAVLGHLAADVHGLHYDRYERLREKRSALLAWEQHLAGVLELPAQHRVGGDDGPH
jgi:integrase